MDLIQQYGQEEQADDLATKFLTFLIDGQYYGLSIQYVIEIIQMQPATPLPELPAYAKGVINLRGRVVPVVDLTLRLGKPEKPYDDRTCIVIVDIDGLYIGFIVDGVDEVLDIPGDRISPPPRFTAGDAGGRYVAGIGNLDRYMVLLLDSSLILSGDEISALEEVAGS